MRTRNHPVEPEELMAYLDGELPHDRAAEAAAHLERCAECQTLAAELREVSQKLSAWQVETPEGVSANDIFAAAKTKEREQPLGAGRGILGWWNVILSNRMLWAGGTVAAMALATVFLISGVQRAKPKRSVMEGYVNPPVSNTETDKVYYYSAPASPVPPARAPRRQESKQAESVKESYDFNFGNAGQNLSATNEPTAPSGASTTAYDSLNRLSQAKPGTSSPVISTTGTETTAISGADTAEARSDSFSTNGVRNKNGTFQYDAGGGLKAIENAKSKDLKKEDRAAANQPHAPMIVHTAQLALVSRDFEQGRAAIEEILKRHGGYVGSLNVNAPPGSGRTLSATLRVPAVQLQETMTELKKLGRVIAESQNGDEITAQYVDLEARLANSRNSEQRLKELQRDRKGKLKDVMDVELQIGRVREEIETMEADRKSMGNRVDFATLTITLAEEYKAELQVVPVSTWTRMGNAAVDGYRTMVEGIVGAVLYVLSVAPSLLLWVVILFYPARRTWKRVKSMKLQRAAV